MDGSDHAHSRGEVCAADFSETRHLHHAAVSGIAIWPVCEIRDERILAGSLHGRQSDHDHVARRHGHQFTDRPGYVPRHAGARRLRGSLFPVRRTESRRHDRHHSGRSIAIRRRSHHLDRSRTSEPFR